MASLLASPPGDGDELLARTQRVGPSLVTARAGQASLEFPQKSIYSPPKNSSELFTRDGVSPPVYKITDYSAASPPEPATPEAPLFS